MAAQNSRMFLLIAAQEAALAGIESAGEIQRHIRDLPGGQDLLQAIPARTERDKLFEQTIEVVKMAGKLELAHLALDVAESKLRAQMLAEFDECDLADPNDVRQLRAVAVRVASSTGRPTIVEGIEVLEAAGRDVTAYKAALEAIYPPTDGDE